MRRIEGFLCVVLGVVSGVGCGPNAQTTGAGGSGGSGVSASSSSGKSSASVSSTGSMAAECGPDFFPGDTDSCHACGEASCCAEKQACDKDPDCKAFAGCTEKCAPSDHACLQACAAPAGGLPVTLELRACLVGHCAASCPLDDLVCGGLAAADPACDASALANCCAEVTARNTSAAALTFLACANGCDGTGDTTTWDCLHACRADNEEGAELVDAAQFCQQTKAPPCVSGCAGAALLGMGQCEGCQSAKCCAESTACNADGRCFAEGKSCVAHCAFDDVACVRACADQIPEAVGALGAVYACVLDQCQTECFPGLGGQAKCGAIGLFDPPTCGACLETSCCGPGLACKEDPECGAIAFCVSSCTDATCVSACEGKYPAAAALWQPYRDCRTSTCGAACGF